MRNILTFLSLLILTQHTLAERSWPSASTDPVRIIVTFTPGGAPDILARVLAEHWQKDHNNQIAITNRAHSKTIKSLQDQVKKLTELAEKRKVELEDFKVSSHKTILSLSWRR